ncbi:MAG: hypothetical protein AB8B57_14165 [Congregibacter sp.]
MRLLPSIAAVVIVVGYFAFEVSNLHRLRYRMEPLYIFDQFASAHIAIQHCGTPDDEERRRFARNFNYVTRRAVEDTVEPVNPDSDDQQRKADAEGSIRNRLELRRQEVEALLAAQGCQGADLRKLVKFHEIRARLNVG